MQLRHYARAPCSRPPMKDPRGLALLWFCRPKRQCAGRGEQARVDQLGFLGALGRVQAPQAVCLVGGGGEQDCAAAIEVDVQEGLQSRDMLVSTSA